MPSPNAIFTELVSTTFRNHGKTIIDNLSNHNAGIRMMKKNGNIKTESGGLTITVPIEYSSNSTYQRYSGPDVLNVTASDVITAVEFPWRQIAINVVNTGLEMRINNGPAQIAKLAKARIKNAINTFYNNFSFDFYSDGTLTNQISGLQALISDSNTTSATVGGINQQTWPFWRHQVQSAAAPIQGGSAITVSATNIEAEIMNPLYIATTRNADNVDTILMSDDWYRLYEASQVSFKRYMKADEAQGGFESLRYKNADVMFDGSSGLPQSHMYFLNTKYLQMITHEEANMTVMSETQPFNQDISIVPILWMGNCIVTNRRVQGVATL